MPEAPTIGALLRTTQERLAAAGIATAALDARLLIMDSLRLSRAELLLRAGDPADAASRLQIESLVSRRLAGEPVYRILGRRPFFEHDFELSPETLEPRPDTEALVELAIGALDKRFGRAQPFIFADIGTGSGAIAVSLLAAFPLAEAIAMDISEGALRTARRNAAAANVATRFHPLRCDYLDALGGPVDAIISNPPYICSKEIEDLDIGVRAFDPLLALDGGSDGLDAYRAIAEVAPACLSAAGYVFFEIGAGQGDDVRALMAGSGYGMQASAADLGGHERALWFAAR